jgi:hypothetical protein
VAVVVGLAVVALGSVRIAGGLRQGKGALAEGRQALLEGRTREAAAAFRRAEQAFDAAVAAGASPEARVGAALPYLGRSVDVLVALGEAGGRLAAAGTDLAVAFGHLPGGFDALAPNRGAIPLGALVTLGPALASAEEDVAGATALLRSAPTGLVPGPLIRARAEALEVTHELGHLLGSAHAFSRALPAFAGAGGVRRYLFFAEDPAELRGTGGLWGAYSLLSVDHGRFRFSPFRPVQTIGTPPPGSVAPPNDDYARNYGEYGAPTYWLNANMTPDFPSAAEATLATWSALGGVPVDGVVVADPFALRELLSVTGGVRMSGAPIRLTSANVVPWLANRAFSYFSNPVERKAVLGQAASTVVERFLALDGRVLPRLRALGRAFSAGHLKVYAEDSEMRRALRVAGVDHALRADGDLAAVVVNGGAGGKIDYFAERTIRHEVRLLQGGGVLATTKVTIANHAPVTGQPRYVIGPHRPGARAGDQIPLVTLFCGPTCELVDAERDGSPNPVRTGTELGYRFFRDYFTIHAGERRTLSLTTSSSGAWEDDGSEGRYRLTIIGQTTIRPTTGEVRLTAPTGMRFVGGSGTNGLVVNGSTATWRGTVPDRLVLGVSIERIPLALRLWRAVVGAT